MRRISIADCRLSTGATAILVVFLALAFFAVPLAAAAQQPAKIPRIGYLSPRPGPSFYDEAFLKGLRELGYIEDQNVAIEYRWANWGSDRLAGFAADLTRLKVDVIVSTEGSAPAVAAKSATRVIPIIFDHWRPCRTRACPQPLPTGRQPYRGSTFSRMNST